MISVTYIKKHSLGDLASHFLFRQVQHKECLPSFDFPWVRSLFLNSRKDRPGVITKVD